MTAFFALLVFALCCIVLVMLMALIARLINGRNDDE